jgi:hypothetical protein
VKVGEGLVESFDSIGAAVLIKKLVHQVLVDHKLLMMRFQKKAKLSLEIIVAAKSQFLLSNLLFRCPFCQFASVSTQLMIVETVFEDGVSGHFFELLLRSLAAQLQRPTQPELFAHSLATAQLQCPTQPCLFHPLGIDCHATSALLWSACFCQQATSMRGLSQRGGPSCRQGKG